jgi:MFS family permease
VTRERWITLLVVSTATAMLLSAGALADRIGRRAIFTWGLAPVHRLLGALRGRQLAGLDLARAAQGIGAAAMFASSLALLANELQDKKRGFALGVWGGVTGASLAIGPLVGGVLTDELDWRWIFLVNLPIGAGINSTFRQLGIAMGIAGLGAIFEHHASDELGLRAGIVAGLNSVLAVAGVVAFLGAVLAWPLLGKQHSAT